MGVVQTVSFEYDALIRNELGKPVGRVVTDPKFDYELGSESINASLIKVLKYYCTKIHGFEFYIDGSLYKVPDKFHEVKLINNEKEWIVSNVVLMKV